MPATVHFIIFRRLLHKKVEIKIELHLTRVHPKVSGMNT